MAQEPSTNIPLCPHTAFLLTPVHHSPGTVSPSAMALPEGQQHESVLERCMTDTVGTYGRMQGQWRQLILCACSSQQIINWHYEAAQLVSMHDRPDSMIKLDACYGAWGTFITRQLQSSG